MTFSAQVVERNFTEGKVCCDCAALKGLDEFPVRDNGRHRPRCKPCTKVYRHAQYMKHRDKQLARQANYRAANLDLIKAQQAQWRAENKEVLKRRNFEKTYGITWEQRQEMLDAQGGLCAICRSDDPKSRDWHMDHDHSCCPQKARSCGKCVRGLLCSRCNIAIGCFDDDPHVMRAAIEYVSRMIPAQG